MTKSPGGRKMGLFGKKKSYEVVKMTRKDDLKKMMRDDLIKVKRIQGTDNVKIFGAGFKPIVAQLGTESVDSIIGARKRLFKKKYGKQPGVMNIYGLPKNW